MVPSPRKGAPTSFETAWTDTDATAFDPATLPVSKAPRAWDRKPEKVVRGDGKEKKVWRRYATRSSTGNVAPDDEELDSRTRAVKRLQKVKPADMELIPAKPHGRKRAFEGTRYDRGKSVLPRKRTAGRDSAGDETAPGLTDDAAVDDMEDMTREAGTRGSESEGQDQHEQPSIPAFLAEESTRSSAFTFTMEEAESHISSRELESNRRVGDARVEEMSGPPTGDDVAGTRPLYSPPFEIATSNTVSQMRQSPATRIPAWKKPGLELQQTASPSAMEDGVDIGEGIGDGTRLYTEGLDEQLETHQDAASSEQTYGNPVQGEDEAADNLVQDANVDSEKTTIFPAQLDVVSDACRLHYSTGREPEARGGEFLDQARSAPLLTTTDNDMPRILETQLDTRLGTVPQQSSEDGDAGRSDAGDLENPKITFSVHSVPSRPIFHLDDTGETAGSSDDDLTEASIQMEIQRDLDQLKTAAPKDATTPAIPSEESELAVQPPSARGMPGEQLFGAQLENNHEKHPTKASVQEALPPTPLAEDTEVQSEIKTGTTALPKDITDGLSLTPSISATKFGEKKLVSPPPPQAGFAEETTSTMLLGVFDEDTAFLQNFLSKAAASKANKTTITRRTSLQNRRDSDAVRQALASPRKALEAKDPNSPSKIDNDVTLDLSQTLTLRMDAELPLSPLPKQGAAPEEAENIPSRTSSRRSTRTRQSRIPPPASSLQIALRRTDGGEPIVLKKTEAQELGLLTRANTRKNKQGFLSVKYKLRMLNQASNGSGNESTSLVNESPPSEEAKSSGTGKKNVRWDETLAYYREHSETIAEAESLATPDELADVGNEVTSTTAVKRKVRMVKEKGRRGEAQTQTPRGKRLRGLGGVNGTPGKALLSHYDEVGEEDDGAPQTTAKAKEKAQPLPKAASGVPSRPKKQSISSASAATTASAPTPELPPEFATSTSNKSTLPTSASAVPATMPSKERKSRLAAPRKVKLPLSSTLPLGSTLLPVPGDAKDSQQGRRVAMGIGGGTPKKGIQVVVPAQAAAASLDTPAPGLESGLPRRRPGRRVP